MAISLAGNFPHMSKDILRRIEEGLAATKLSRRAASLKAQLNPEALRELYRKPDMSPTIRTIEKIASALELQPAYLAFGLGEKSAAPSHLLPVKGEVAAGLWHDIDGDIDETTYEPVAMPIDPRWPSEAQYGLLVRGTSINRVAEAGDVLQCIDAGIANLTPRDEDLVIVERRRAQGSQKEVTAKRFRRGASSIELWPDSTDDRWQKPFVLNGDGHDSDEELAVIAVVIGVYKPLRRN